MARARGDLHVAACQGYDRGGKNGFRNGRKGKMLFIDEELSLSWFIERRRLRGDALNREIADENPHEGHQQCWIARDMGITRPRFLLNSGVRQFTIAFDEKGSVASLKRD